MGEDRGCVSPHPIPYNRQRQNVVLLGRTNWLESVKRLGGGVVPGLRAWSYSTFDNIFFFSAGGMAVEVISHCDGAQLQYHSVRDKQQK